MDGFKSNGILEYVNLLKSKHVYYVPALFKYLANPYRIENHSSSKIFVGTPFLFSS